MMDDINPVDEQSAPELGLSAEGEAVQAQEPAPAEPGAINVA